MRATLALLILASAVAAEAQQLGGILSPVASPAAPARRAAGDSLQTPAGPTRGASVLEEKDVLGALERELTAQLNLDGELRLSFARPWAAVRVGEGEDWKISITQLPAGGLAASPLIRFRAEAAGRLLGEWQAVVRAQLWKSVWVASRRLDRGQLLDATLCTAQSIDVLRERQALVPADTELSRYELAQTISQERPLAWRDITLRPLVRKGQVVDVVATDGALTINMKATAMSNGGAGEAVVVRNPASRKDFSAKVTAANTVQVAF